MNRYLLIMVAFFLQIHIIYAATEEQKLSEEQKLKDMQKLEELQKLMEMQKLMELQKLMEMQKYSKIQKNSEITNSPEVQEFMDQGFNIKHYRRAAQLNLDVENYKNYLINKRNRKKGNILMGVGSGIATMGLLIIIDAATTKIHNNTNDEYYLFGDDAFEDIITGGMCVGTGLGLTIGGIVKRNKIGKVVTKKGVQLSLLPKADVSNDRYGAKLSFSF